MLASLLPGLRDIRTPLTVGYLWLVTGWLIWGDKFPDSRPAGHGVVAELFDLNDLLGRGASIAAVSFVAYVLGALLSTSAEGGWALKLLDRGPFPDASRTRQEYENYLDYQLEEKAMRRAREVVRVRAQDDVARALIEDGPTSTMESARHASIADLRVRLLVANQELYGEYDRFMAEASFRLNLFAPLIALGILVSSDLGWWVGVLAACIATALLLQGSMRLTEAVTVIRRAVVAQVFVHPLTAVLDAEAERLDEVIRREQARREEYKKEQDERARRYAEEEREAERREAERRDAAERREAERDEAGRHEASDS